MFPAASAVSSLPNSLDLRPQSGLARRSSLAWAFFCCKIFKLKMIHDLQICDDKTEGSLEVKLPTYGQILQQRGEAPETRKKTLVKMIEHEYI